MFDYNKRCLPLAFGTFLFILALYKALQFWKEGGIWGSRLVLVLITDQAIYFLLYARSPNSISNPQRHPLTHTFCLKPSMISCATFNIVNDSLPSATLLAEAVMQTLGNPTLLSILGSRMFFNLKEAAEHGINTGTNWISHELIAGCSEEPDRSSWDIEY